MVGDYHKLYSISYISISQIDMGPYFKSQERQNDKKMVDFAPNFSKILCFELSQLNKPGTYRSYRFLYRCESNGFGDIHDTRVEPLVI